jgi:hypothetical protein
MTEPEDLVRSTTRAIASTVRDVPPLRLAPAEGHVLPFDPVTRRARRLRGWLAPVTAAAVVLAVAVSLVIIRDIPNGRVVPAASPASPVSVPAYYVAISAPTTAGRNDLVVGDTSTGGRLATVPAPNGTVFGVVTAAADDRTFVVDALPTSGAVRYATWYLLRISPGTSSPARLTRLAIPATPVSVFGAATVSESGSELALMLQPFHGMIQPTATTTTLRIYSVATGRLLRSWSTNYLHVLAEAYPGATPNNTLTWVDGDRAVAFNTYRYISSPNSSGTPWATTVRVLDVTARGDNLILDSRAVAPGCPGPPGALAPPLTANGRTVLCAQMVSPFVPNERKTGGTLELTWSAYSASAPTAPRTLYQVSVRVPPARVGAVTVSGDAIGVQWADATGAAMIVDWAVGTSTGPLKAHFGVVSQGRFVPLPTPAAGVTGLNPLSEIAW